MPMIQKINQVSVEQRLNSILDKISEGKKVSDTEFQFLKSWKYGHENDFNHYLNRRENEIYLSDDGYFKFIFKEIEEIEDCKIITGTITIPDPIVDEIKISITGNILIFKESHIAVDFRINEIDIFEFIEGKEEQLDDFIYEIIADKT